MNNTIRLLIFLILFNSNAMIGQDLSKHTWENRLLLVVVKNTDDLEFQEQIGVLKNNQKGLKERKLIVYQITPEAYKEGLFDGNVWNNSKVLFEQYGSKNKSLEIILIGLDGGIKLRQTEVLDIETLFSTIDKMPMRRSEMKRKD